MSILAISALVLAIIAIILVVVTYLVPRPIIDDVNRAENKTYSSNKIELAIEDLNKKIEALEAKTGTLPPTATDIITYVNNKLDIGNDTVKEFVIKQTTFPDENNDATEISTYIRNKLFFTDANLPEYVNRTIVNNTAFANTIASNDNLKNTVINQGIINFFASNNTNNIHTINCTNIKTNTLDKNTANITISNVANIGVSGTITTKDLTVTNYSKTKWLEVVEATIRLGTTDFNWNNLVKFSLITGYNKGIRIANGSGSKDPYEGSWLELNIVENTNQERRLAYWADAQDKIFGRFFINNYGHHKLS